MSEILGYRFLDNTLLDWGLASVAFLFTFLVIPFVRGRVRAHRVRWAASHRSVAVDLISLLISKTSRLVLLILALYFAESILTLPPNVDRAFDIVIIVGAWMQVGIWTTAALRFYIDRRTNARDAATQTSVSILMFGAQLLIWAVFALLALDNLGVNITALVAGLGVGGVAVALATQTLLGDLFGSLSIAFDKPFAVGDALKLDDVEGTVEYIGLRSTRLRSITGEQVILANADILKARLRNLGRMPEKRFLFSLLVGYDTPPEKLDAIAPMVERLVRAQPDTRFIQCVLNSLGAYSIEFQAIYFIANRPDVPQARINDAIYRGILREFAAQGISLAYPTQKLMMEHGPRQDGEQGPAPAPRP